MSRVVQRCRESLSERADLLAGLEDEPIGEDVHAIAANRLELRKRLPELLRLRLNLWRGAGEELEDHLGVEGDERFPIDARIGRRTGLDDVRAAGEVEEVVEIVVVTDGAARRF